jgi:hypothetical protein
MTPQDWNPLSYFRELGTLAKVLLLLGFAFLAAGLFHGVSPLSATPILAFCFISSSVACHYLSKALFRLSDPPYPLLVDWPNMIGGIAMSIITVGLIVWLFLTPSAKPSTTKDSGKESIQSSGAGSSGTPVSPPQSEQTTAKPKERADATSSQSARVRIKGPNTTGVINQAGNGNASQVGNDNQSTVVNAPGGIPIVDNRGTVTNPTVNNFGPVPRRLSDRTKGELSNCFRTNPGRFCIAAIGNNSEAYKYAGDWRDVLIAAGWQIKHTDIPIQIVMIAGGMWSGMRSSVHNASQSPDTQLLLADGSPEKTFSECVMGRNDLSGGGSIIPYKDTETGEVDIVISDNPAQVKPPS